MGVFKWQKYKLTENPIGCCLERRKPDGLGKLLTLSYNRIEYTLILGLASLLLCPYRTAMGRKQTSTETLAGANVHSYFIPNSQNLGTNQVSTQRRRNKQIVVT